ncbi:MAG: purine-nucleoside phosphorylase [Clostridia bacterium]|nr:purine-nucleoside phosphorylase [Clostridia bacterium]
MIKIKESVEFVKSKLGGREPVVLGILGSGIGFLGDMVEDAVYINYDEIPNFAKSTAIGHKGRFVCGTLAGKCVLLMQGRVHYYEGYSMDQVTFPVYVAAGLGIKNMIVTNAAGGINTDFSVGDIMLICDHIKLMGESPLRGENKDTFGVRFPDMSCAYDRDLCDLARKVASDLNITLREGVYFYALGPQYETPAEIRAMRILGADVVGMSTAPEVIAANHAGMRVLGFALVSNMASGILDKPLCGEEVIKAGAAEKEKFSALFIKCIEGFEV